MRASRSSGPGGQHANVTASRVEAIFDVGASAALSEDQKRRVMARCGPVVRAVAQDTRSQRRNRDLALERLAGRLARALAVQRQRKATRPTRAARSAGSSRNNAGARRSGSGAGPSFNAPGALDRPRNADATIAMVQMARTAGLVAALFLVTAAPAHAFFPDLSVELSPPSVKKLARAHRDDQPAGHGHADRALHALVPGRVHRRLGARGRDVRTRAVHREHVRRRTPRSATSRAIWARTSRSTGPSARRATTPSGCT